MSDDFVVRVERPFAIFFQPADDVPGAWIAHVVGHELDNVTQGNGPVDTIFAAADLMALITNSCHDGQRAYPDHEMIDGTIVEIEGESPIPAMCCTRCPLKVAKRDA